MESHRSIPRLAILLALGGLFLLLSLVLLPSVLAAARITPVQAAAMVTASSTPVTIRTVSPMTQSSAMPTATSASSNDQALFSEAQNDITIANIIITWSGLFLALIAAAVTVAALFGARELRQIREVRRQFESHVQKVEALEQEAEQRLKQLAQRFEHDSQTFMEASYDFSVASEAYRGGDNARAIEYYQRALELQPRNTQVMERLGRCYTNLGKITEAVSYFEKALTINPRFAAALRGLSTCFRYIDRSRAIDYVKQGLDVNPLDYDGWNYLGLLYRDGGEIEEAISAHERALAIKKIPECEFYLSILYAIKGDKRRAKFMALAADLDTQTKEHSGRMRGVWAILIHCGALIFDDDHDEALKVAATLSPHMTGQRVYDALTSHLWLLLQATGHDKWLPEFKEVVKVQVLEHVNA